MPSCQVSCQMRAALRSRHMHMSDITDVRSYVLSSDMCYACGQDQLPEFLKLALTSQQQIYE